jgi:hypothetical protein
MDPITIVVEASTLEQAVARALQEVLAAAMPAQPTTSGGSRSVPLRAQGDTPAEVTAGMIEALLDELATDALVDVRLDGLLRRDGGTVAWGYASLGETAQASLPLRLSSAPAVTVAPGRVAIRLELTSRL